MSLLSYVELCELVEAGVIGPVEPDQINGSSIDIRLGNEIIIELATDHRAVVSPKDRTNFPQKKIDMRDKGFYDLTPNEFCLANSVEVFNLPMDISAEFRLKSSGARSGLNNLFACHCDPGWKGSTLTLELHNVLTHTYLRLTPGMYVGQILFHRHAMPVPYERSYTVRGRYVNDLSVQEVKP